MSDSRNAASGAAAPGVDGEFVITRLFDAPRELVFRAWTEPRHVSQRWGPPVFTCPVCDLDVRPGGAYRIVMRGPDGTDYPVKGVYREIARPERLVMTMDCSEHPKAWHDLINPNREKGDTNPAGEMLETVTFEEVGAKTKVTVRIRPKNAAIRDAMVEMGMNEGWSLSLDRLEPLLASTVTADREIIVTRVFDASRDMVFDAWTDPKQVEQWWGPRGFTTTMSEMDVRPGGVWRLVMHGPDGTDYKNKIVFVEVARPERLVYKHEPEPGTEPVSFQTTVTFAEQDGKTKVTMRLAFPSAVAREHVVKKHGAMEGANQTIDRLGEHLALIGKN